MLEAILRPRFQRYCVDSVAKVLSTASVISPLDITLLAGICGIGTFVLLVNSLPVIASVLLLISGYLDVLDGSLARVKGSHCAFGAVLDIVMDRFVEFAMVLGLFWVDPISRGLLCMLMLGSILLCVTSFLVVGIFSDNHSEKSFHYSPGLMERAEAFIFFIAMMIWPQGFTLLAILFTVLVLLTTITRVFQFWHQIRLGT